MAALLDIDDFKFINEIYGHVYGDRALKSLTDSMKAFFPKNTLLGRNGGDEFCILLPDHTYKEAGELLLQFTKLPKTFSCKECGQKCVFGFLVIILSANSSNP